jgi:hypothetical protein
VPKNTDSQLIAQIHTPIGTAAASREAGTKPRTTAAMRERCSDSNTSKTARTGTTKTQAMAIHRHPTVPRPIKMTTVSSSPKKLAATPPMSMDTESPAPVNHVSTNAKATFTRGEKGKGRSEASSDMVSPGAKPMTAAFTL